MDEESCPLESRELSETPKSKGSEKVSSIKDVPVSLLSMSLGKAEFGLVPSSVVSKLSVAKSDRRIMFDLVVWCLSGIWLFIVLFWGDIGWLGVS